MNKAIFYHAGCSVCVSAEQKILETIDRCKVQLEVVHLGKQKARINEAKGMGVKSVPALVIDREVLHINFGAAISDV